MGKAVVLLIEGERVGGDSFSRHLNKAGFETHCAHSGKEALGMVERIRPNIIVFDANTMRSSGLRTMAQFSNSYADQTPLIYCPAKESVAEVAEAFPQRVYVMQHPFTSRKLVNTIRRLLPPQEGEEKITRLGPITLYTVKRALHIVGRGNFSLTPKLVLLLQLFLQQPNQLMTRKGLMRAVWDTDYVGDTRTLDVHVRWVREMLEEDPSRPQLLLTVRGEGYILSWSESADDEKGQLPTMPPHSK